MGGCQCKEDRTGHARISGKRKLDEGQATLTNSGQAEPPSQSETVSVLAAVTPGVEAVGAFSADVESQQLAGFLGTPGAEAVPVFSSAEAAQQLATLLKINLIDVGGIHIDQKQVNPSAQIKELKAELAHVVNADPWHLTLLHGQDILEDACQWMNTSVEDSDDVIVVIQPRTPLQDATIQKAVDDVCRGGEAKKGAEFCYGHISRWETEEVTNMTCLFLHKVSFNEDLNAWNVSKVTDMWCMFNSAMSFNGDLSAWNVSSVKSMSSMFSSAAGFNKDLNNWTVSGVTTMEGMFNGASVFNGDLNAWNVSKVTNMALMFQNAERFNRVLSAWNVSNVNDMSSMFYAARSFNTDLSAWNVSSVTATSAMFALATSFKRDVNAWNASSAANSFINVRWSSF